MVLLKPEVPMGMWIGERYWGFIGTFHENTFLCGIILFLAILWIGALEGMLNAIARTDIGLALWLRPAIIIWAVAQVGSRRAYWTTNVWYAIFYGVAAFAGMASAEFILNNPAEIWHMGRLSLEFVAIGYCLSFPNRLWQKRSYWYEREMSRRLWA